MFLYLLAPKRKLISDSVVTRRPVAPGFMTEVRVSSSEEGRMPDCVQWGDQPEK